MASRKNLFDNLNLSDASYLLDPSLKTEDMPKEKVTRQIKKAIKSADKVPISSLRTFEDHPYLVDETTDDFAQLLESIRENGIVEPLLVRPLDNETYEIVSGHRRKRAAEICGLDEVPVIIREMDNDTATILMVHSNFYREKIRISEKAKAYRMCMDAERHQGKKGIDTAGSVGKDNDSKRQVQRYVRLTYLDEEFFPYLDDGILAMNAGVELSFLDAMSQKMVLTYMSKCNKVPSLEQASLIRKNYESNGTLDYSNILEIIEGNTEKKAPAVKVTLNEKKLFEYFPPEMTVSNMQEIIYDLLQGYKDGTIILKEGIMTNSTEE